MIHSFLGSPISGSPAAVQLHATDRGRSERRAALRGQESLRRLASRDFRTPDDHRAAHFAGPSGALRRMQFSNPTFSVNKNCFKLLLRYCEECGVPNKKNRIVGGHETNVNQYPWMALLTYGGRFYCGATLINDRYVLTGTANSLSNDEY